MESKPSKAKIAGMAAAVVVVSGLMAWALISAFQADQSRYDSGFEDTYGADLDPALNEEGADFEADLEQPVSPAAVKPAKPSAASASPVQKKEPVKAAAPEKP